MRRLIATTALLLLIPGAASAQDTFCAQETACTTAVSTSSATTIAGIGVTMLTRIRKRKIAALGLFVRMNEVAILGAVGRRGGQILVDLAELAGVPEEDLDGFIERVCQQREKLRVAFAGTAEPRYLGTLVLDAAEE